MKLPPWWPKALLVVLALLVWRWHDAGQQREGALREQIRVTEQRVKAREQVIAVLAARVPKIDTVWHLDAKTAVAWASRYQNLRDSLRAAGPDAISIPIILTVADSAVASCTRALHSCASAVAIRDTLLAHKDTLQWAADSLLRLERKRRGGFRFLGVPLGCTVGGVVSPKGIQPGAGCGVRF